MLSSFIGSISLALILLTTGGFFALEPQSPPPGFPFPNFPFPPSYEIHIVPSECTECGASWSGPRYQVNEGFDLKAMIAEVYEIDPIRIDLPDSLNDGKRYDFALLLPKEESQQTINHLIQDGIKGQFRLTIAFEVRPMDVYVLTAPNGRVPALKVSRENSNGGSAGTLTVEGNGKVRTEDPDEVSRSGFSITGISVSDSNMESVCRSLERALGRIVIDDTQLRGDYSFQVRDAHTMDQLLQKLRDRFGLVLTPDQRDVKILVVHSA
jgi:uncharacterized protein (TIGR03435 family)